MQFPVSRSVGFATDRFKMHFQSLKVKQSDTSTYNCISHSMRAIAMVFQEILFLQWCTFRQDRHATLKETFPDVALDQREQWEEYVNSRATSTWAPNWPVPGSQILEAGERVTERAKKQWARTSRPVYYLNAWNRLAPNVKYFLVSYGF